MKHFIPVLLATMAIIAGIAGSVSKSDHWGAAIFFYIVCGVLGLSALVAGYIESIPKPFIVPVGYGHIGDQVVQGVTGVSNRRVVYSRMPENPLTT